MRLNDINYVVAFIGVILLISCQSVRYRHDNKNRMTKKAEKAMTFLSDQAVEITQDNIDHRDQKDKESNKKS